MKPWSTLTNHSTSLTHHAFEPGHRRTLHSHIVRGEFVISSAFSPDPLVRAHKTLMSVYSPPPFHGAPAPDKATPGSRLSCLNCRERKQRCDRSVPACSRCTALHQACECPSSRRSNRGKRRQVKDLEVKIGQSMVRLARCGPQADERACPSIRSTRGKAQSHLLRRSTGQ